MLKFEHISYSPEIPAQRKGGVSRFGDTLAWDTLSSTEGLVFPQWGNISTALGEALAERGVIGTPAVREFTHNDLVATIDRLFDKGLLRSSRKSRWGWWIQRS